MQEIFKPITVANASKYSTQRFKSYGIQYGATQELLVYFRDSKNQRFFLYIRHLEKDNLNTWELKRITLESLSFWPWKQDKVVVSGVLLSSLADIFEEWQNWNNEIETNRIRFDIDFVTETVRILRKLAGKKKEEAVV